jgi:plasmid maintenance system antidote protein VapI
MALRIERAFGVNMDTLMRMQAAYDIAQARTDAGKIRVRRYQPASATGHSSPAANGSASRTSSASRSG